MENTLLYFSKDDNERGVYPAKNFLGVDMTDADTMQISFLKEDGAADAAIVSLTIATGEAKLACEVLAGALAGQKKGLTIVADAENSKFLHPFTAIESIA
jgi:hypothetical protein